MDNQKTSMPMDAGVDKAWLKALLNRDIPRPHEYTASDVRQMAPAKAQSKIQSVLQQFYWSLVERMRDIKMSEGKIIDGPSEDMFDGFYDELDLDNYTQRYGLYQFFNTIARGLQLKEEYGSGTKQEFQKMFAKISQRCIEEKEYVEKVAAIINEKYPNLAHPFKSEPSIEELNELQETRYRQEERKIDEKVESNVDEFKDKLAKIKRAKQTDFERIAQQLNTVVIFGWHEWETVLYALMSPRAPRMMINGLDYRSNIHVMLAGDISTAKSVRGDVPVFIAGKGPTTIAEVIDERIERSSTIHRERDTEWVECSGLHTYAINPETFRMEITEINKLIRHKSPSKLYRVRTQTGRILDGCTKDHSFLVLSEGELIEKPIEVGDHIPVPRRLPLIESLQEITLDYADRFPQAARIRPIKLDHLTGYAVGAFLSQGSPSNDSIQWSTSNEEARKKIAAWLKGMNLTHGETKTMIYKSSKWLREWFEETCYSGAKTKKGKGSGAYRKKVPDYAFSAPKEFREGLIEGYSLDGHLRKGWRTEYKEWDIKSASYRLHNGISMLLATIDTFSKLSDSTVEYKGDLRTYSALVIPKEDLSKDYWDIIPDGTKLIYPYAKKLGWCKRGSENRDWTATLRTRMKQGNIFRKQFMKDVAKIETQWGPLPQKIKRFENPDVIWDEVVEITEIAGDEYVYDFSTKHENFIAGHGGLITHNSKVCKIAKIIAPKMVSVDDTTRATFEGVAPTKSGEEIEEGVIDWANNGTIIVEEFTNVFAKMPLFRRVMDCEEVTIFKKGSEKHMRVNTTMLAACNPDADFFLEEVNGKPVSFRNQIAFKEGILSRFDVLVPLTATQVKNEMLADKMHMLKPTTPEEETKFQLIKEDLDTIAVGMATVSRVVITDDQERRMKEVFLSHNEVDRERRILKNRPLVLLRDLETLGRFVNTIATVNFRNRMLSEGVLFAADEDVEKAISLWENLLQLRVQLYGGRGDRNLRTIADEILLFIHRMETADPTCEDGVPLPVIKQEFVDIQRLCVKSTFYEQIRELRETGRIIQKGERNAKITLVIK